MSQKLIKSKQRVKKHGEVYTPTWLVENMLDNVPGVEQIESTVLEPTCGNGNFLIAILRRKVKTVDETVQHLGKDDRREQWEELVGKALSNIYAIDILLDNVEESRQRLFKYIDEEYQIRFRCFTPKPYISAIQTVLRNNVICGDALEIMKAPEQHFLQYEHQKRQE